MRTTFFLLALVNFAAAAIGGGVASLTIGTSLLAVGYLWGDDSQDDDE